MIAKMNLFQISTPNSSRNATAFVNSLASFDIIYNVDSLNFPEYFNFTTSGDDIGPYNEYFEALGLDSMGFWEALGSMAVIFALVALNQVLGPLVKYLGNKSPTIRKSVIFRYIKNNTELLHHTRFTIVNTWVRMLLEGYIDIGVTCVLMLVYAKQRFKENEVDFKRQDKFNYFCGVVFAVIIVIFTFLILYLTVFQFRHVIETEKIKVKK